MKTIKNYTKPLFLVALIFVLYACNSDQNKNTAIATNETTQTPTQTVSQTEIHSFSLTDTLLKTPMNKALNICLPISTTKQDPLFTVTTTKLPTSGILNATSKGTKLCFDYTPKTGFTGTDQFTCIVCLISSSLCQEKTWSVEVNDKGTSASKTISKPTSTTVSKPEIRVQETPPQAKPVNNSSLIFDPNKKNTDGYEPKKDN